MTIGSGINISEFFIKRPVTTTLLMAALIFYGIFAYRLLPVSDLPDVEFPTILVTASLPGANPETMASTVATPLEKQFATIAGLETMNSVSTLGSTQITLQFNLDRNVDGAAVDVQSALTAAARLLPPNMPELPSFRKVNPSASPILYLALSSDTLPLSAVNMYAETLLAQRLSMVQGVAQVSVFGSQKYAVRIQVNPDKLYYNEIGLDEVVSHIQDNNVDLPTGNLDGSTQSYLIKVNGQLTNADAYRRLPLTYSNNGILRLGDIAKVQDSVANNRVASWHNGKRGIILAIQRQPGSNTIAVIDAIKKILPEFQRQLPATVKLSVMFDRSISIRDSVSEVQFSLVLAAILVILIIFLFLKNITATMIPAVVLPLSIIGTFAFMYFFHFSIDNLSLLALTLSVGYVVDDAIVMLENIFRYIEQGEAPMQAALTGSRQVSFTILSMTLSLVAVFIPVLFMGGLLGRILFEFGMTITIAILMSGIISLTLTPMLASRFIRGKVNHDQYAWQRSIEAFYSNVLRLYEVTLRWALQHHRITFLGFVATLFLSVFLFYVVPKGFLPSEDTGQLFAYTEADPAVSFAVMTERQKEIADIVQKNPNVESVFSAIGSGGATSSTNAGRLFMRLTPRAGRDVSADEIAEDLRRQFQSVTGITTYIQNIPSIMIGKLSKSTYQYTLQSGDLSELYQWADVFTREFTKIAELQDVTSDLQYTGPQINIHLLRDQMAALGISARQVETTLGFAYGAQRISTIYRPEDDYDVLIELLPEFQDNPGLLSQLYIRGNNDRLVPLKMIANIDLGKGLMTVNHLGQLPAVTVSFNLKPGVSLSEAVSQIEAIKNKLQPPVTLLASFQGTAQIFKSSIVGLGLLLLVAILTVYLILGMLYESFIHPLTILSGLPSAGVGALVTLMLFNMDLNLYSFIGIIMLVGIVKKNAIIMIDFALEIQRKDNKLPAAAIFEACLLRFRPIMMTTMAALMGVLPIALAVGAGSESRRPLGLAVMGGLLFSQFLTLYITPVIYLYLEKFARHSD